MTDDNSDTETDVPAFTQPEDIDHPADATWSVYHNDTSGETVWAVQLPVDVDFGGISAESGDWLCLNRDWFIVKPSVFADLYQQTETDTNREVYDL